MPNTYKKWERKQIEETNLNWELSSKLFYEANHLALLHYLLLLNNIKPKS